MTKQQEYIDELEAKVAQAAQESQRAYQWWKQEADQIRRGLQAEIEGLQTIVDNLRKTADGVLIKPNMRVWFYRDRELHSGNVETQYYYSTLEAAEAGGREG